MAYNPIYKARDLSRNFSREAGHIEYDTTGKQPLIGNKRPIGGANTDQTSKGVTYGNVQSAIDDLYSISQQMPINSIITLAEDSPPTAIQQTESLTFGGTVLNIAADSTQAVVHVYGFPFIFNNGINASSVCEAVEQKFQEFVAAELYFNQVTRKGVNGEILEVQFIDCLPHEATLTTEHGITVSGVIDVEAQQGYGTWSKLGSGELPGVTPAVTAYYYKRIA